MGVPASGDDNKSPIQEIVQPFIDLVRAPRALWGINLAYVLEGLVYFGMLGYLAMHFSDFVFQAVEHADEWSHNSVMVLTAGITLAMVGLGWVCDKWGVRKALILAFILLLAGRTLIAAAPNLLGLDPARPGVQVGDKISLHIEELETRDGIKSIVESTVYANDEGGHDVLGMMSVDLAPGAGIVPGPRLDGKLVHIGRAMVGKGEKQDWTIEYGEPPVEARWIVHAAENLRICKGAQVTIDNGYVTSRFKDGEVVGWVVRSHWEEDVSDVDLSGCPVEPLEGELVDIGRATVGEGKKRDWEIEYGDPPVRARWIVHADDPPPICEGALVTIDNGYVTQPEEGERVIRAYWDQGVSEVDVSGCVEKPEESRDSSADDLRTDERWEIPTDHDSSAAQPTSIAALRDTDDGKVDLLVQDAYVTYVRNGGYYLQSTGGATIFVFIDPLWSPLHLITLLGIVIVVFGYGMYQPAAYAAVRQFTTPKTAAMGFAMLYALMNLGGWLPSFAFLLRDEDYLGFGIPGTYWVYVGLTALALVATLVILTRKTVSRAIQRAKEETAKIKAAEEAAKTDEEKAGEKKTEAETAAVIPPMVDEVLPWYIWVLYLGLIVVSCTVIGDGGLIIACALLVERTLFVVVATRTAGKVVRTGGPLGESSEPQMFPMHVWVLLTAIVIVVFWRVPAPMAYYIAGALVGLPVVLRVMPTGPRDRALAWIRRHPLADAKFFFFIFALIPVQTLFTYNWLVLPQYIERAFTGWISDYFEIAANLNPILIFIAVPIIAAVTRKAKVYNMMVWGTLVMAAPAFLLVIGPHWWTLFPYLFIMTIGEAMWQPRFLQYAAEIAPEGRTGEYMGVAQLPWFLTKMVAPLLLTGWTMSRYCPAEGEQNTRFMWLLFACIAMTSTMMLVLARSWIGKDFKTKA